MNQIWQSSAQAALGKWKWLSQHVQLPETRGQCDQQMPSSEQKNGLIVMLRAYVLGFAAAASLTNNYAVVEAALPFDCDEGFHEERRCVANIHAYDARVYETG